MNEMIFEKIKEILSEQTSANIEDIKIESSFDSLGLDSLDLMQVLMELEDAFDIKIDESNNMKTVGDLVAYIENQKG